MQIWKVKVVTEDKKGKKFSYESEHHNRMNAIRYCLTFDKKNHETIAFEISKESRLL